MASSGLNKEATLGEMFQRRSLRRYLKRRYVSVNRWIWNHLAAARRSRRYGRHLHRLIELQQSRKQRPGTFFLRNRPELDLLTRLLDWRPQGSTQDVAILGCSKGAEVYSFAYAIRRARPDLKIRIRAVDIDQDVVEFAEGGVYALAADGASRPSGASSFGDSEYVARNTFRDQILSIFQGVSPSEMEMMFDRDGNLLRVKAEFREGITWHIGDAGDTQLRDFLGPQDIVVANRFLCHMGANDAEACLRSLVRLVKPGGYLFVSGVDLSVRSKVAQELHWEPVLELIREVHEGDPSLRHTGPWNTGSGAF